MTTRGFLVRFVLAMAICSGVSAAMRHVGAPDLYPVVSSDGLPEWRTFRPSGRYRSLLSRNSRNYGDLAPVYEAARTWRFDGSVRLYNDSQLTQGVAGFVYTPVSAMLLVPLTGEGWTLPSAADAVHVANLVLWLAGGAMLFGIITYRRTWHIGGLGVFAFVYLAFYPLADAIFLTQAQVWIWFLLVAAAFLLQRARPAGAGAALGFGVSIKPHLVLVLLLLAITPRFPRKMIAAAIVTVLLLGGGSIAWVGPENMMDYAVHTLPSLSAGYAYYPNQSVNGLLLRLGRYADPAVFNLAPRVEWIRIASSLFGLAVLIFAAIALRRRAGETDEVTCFALAVAAATLASPVIWMHHLTSLAVGLVVLARYIVYRNAGTPSGLRTAAFLGLVLVASYFDGSKLEGVPLALLTGFEFYGALVILACLAWVTRDDVNV